MAKQTVYLAANAASSPVTVIDSINKVFMATFNTASLKFSEQEVLAEAEARGVAVSVIAITVETKEPGDTYDEAIERDYIGLA